MSRYPGFALNSVQSGRCANPKIGLPILEKCPNLWVAQGLLIIVRGGEMLEFNFVGCWNLIL